MVVNRGGGGGVVGGDGGGYFGVGGVGEGITFKRIKGWADSKDMLLAGPQHTGKKDGETCSSSWDGVWC